MEIVEGKIDNFKGQLKLMEGVVTDEKGKEKTV